MQFHPGSHFIKGPAPSNNLRKRPPPAPVHPALIVVACTAGFGRTEAQLKDQGGPTQGQGDKIRRQWPTY